MNENEKGRKKGAGEKELGKFRENHLKLDKNQFLSIQCRNNSENSEKPIYHS